MGNQSWDRIKSQQVHTGHIKKSSKDLNVETDISDNQTFQQHNGMYIMVGPVSFYTIVIDVGNNIIEVNNNEQGV